MSISVRLSASLRNSVPGYNSEEGIELTISGAQSARALAESLDLPILAIKMVMLNGRKVKLDNLVKDGDRLAFFPPIGGG